MTRKLRHHARQYALQALYQWAVHPLESHALIAEFLTDHIAEHKIDQAYFEDLVSGTIKNQEAIDELLRTKLDRSIHSLNPVELAILRVAVYELRYRLDIPHKVVIDEAVELAKEFGSTEGHKYVNGVLDALHPALRHQNL